MKLSEIKGERALEVLAELIDPIAEMVQDEGFKNVARAGDKMCVVKYLLKSHGKNVIKVLALINGEDPNTYEPTLLQLPMMVLELFEDPDVNRLFGLQSQTDQLASSGSVTENIEASEK